MSVTLDQILEKFSEIADKISSPVQTLDQIITTVKRVDSHFWKEPTTGIYGVVNVGIDSTGTRRLLKVGTDGSVSTVNG